LLSTKAAHLAYRESLDADTGERLRHFIQLEWLEDGFDLLHLFPPGAPRGAMLQDNQTAKSVLITVAFLRIAHAPHSVRPCRPGCSAHLEQGASNTQVDDRRSRLHRAHRNRLRHSAGESGSR